MATINLLYSRSYPINDDIKIYIPTVGEVIENEDSYFGLVSSLTAMPIDMMVQLDDVGIDFTQIDEYELFLMLFRGIQSEDTRLVFGDLDLSKFEPAVNEQNNLVVLIDRENDIVIDKAIHGQIAATLRKINLFEKDRRKPANKEAKEYMLERARIKQKRRSKRKQVSQLESLIISMVCTEQYKYNFETTKDLTIYQFNKSVRQIIDKVQYDNVMYGVYSGSINAKSLSEDQLNWLAK